MNELLLVSKQSVKTVINIIKQQQSQYITLGEKSSQSELTGAYKGVFKLIGTVDALRSLDVLTEDEYQGLVEENVHLEEKLRLLLKAKKSTQSIASRVERVGNNSRS
jgi:hypothetical protein